MANFLRWYSGEILPPRITGSYLQVILSLPILSEILTQQSFMSALNLTPGSMSLP